MKVTPEDLRTLSSSQQLQKATLLFFEKSADSKGFVNGKPSREFFAVRSFFKKQPLETLHLLYDYLWNIEGEQKLSMGDCFRKAREYQEGLRVSTGKAKETYVDYRKALEDM